MASNPIHRRFKAGPKRPKAAVDANGTKLNNKEKNALKQQEHDIPAASEVPYGGHAQGRLFTRERLRVDLAALNRDPFRDLLSMFIGNHPEETAIQDMAKDNPNQWVNSVVNLAKLAGYTERLEVTQNIYARLLTMSDSELETELSKLNQVIDLKALPDPIQKEQDKTKEQNQDGSE